MKNRETFALFFTIRKSNKLVNGETPIILRITVNGQRTEMRTLRQIKPENWNSARCMAKGKDKTSREINEYIDSIRLRALDIQRALELENVKITANMIKARLQGKVATQKTIVEIFNEHNEQISKLEGIDFTKTTIGRYKLSLQILVDFMKHEYKMEDMPIKDIDPKFIDNYRVFLRANKMLSNNSAVKRLKNLKKVILIALKNNWITLDPFRFTKLKEDVVEKDFLMRDEIEKIASKEINIERLAQVRDVFIFSVFTGLAYTDVASLKPEHIITDSNGVMWIRKPRDKNSNMSTIPLLEVPEQILKKYEFCSKCKSSGKLLPILSNQRMNSYLKELADICGLKKRLTYHVARHSYATLCITNGISLESVSKMLGHSNTRITQHYAKILDSKVNQEMDKMRGQFAL